MTKSYVKVPEGKLWVNATIFNGQIKGNGAEQDSIPEFYISSTEVTNWNWKEFLMYLKQEEEWTSTMQILWIQQYGDKSWRTMNRI